MHSCIYEGRVRHRRARPVPHDFEVSLYMLYIDLDELPSLDAASLVSTRRRPFGAWFRREDYMAPTDEPLADTVRRLFERRTGRATDGPIRMLTQVRRSGYNFNPVTFYYLFDRRDKHVESIAAEITNTPWKDRSTYVLQAEESASRRERVHATFPKTFHVSPFMPMELMYDWRFSTPSSHLSVHMENHDSDGRLFDATLSMRRVEMTRETLRLAARRHPFMTWRIVASIYLQALRLSWKRVPFFSHPDNREPEASRP